MQKVNRKIIDLFIDYLPKLDLHGMDREIASLNVCDFIEESKKMGHNEIVIIHGIGTGILKREVHKILRQHKNVENFYSYHFNSGCTIVKINVDKRI